MEYQKKENSYYDYKKYSQTVLKTQEIESGGNVQGYIATEQEEREKNAPVETMRLKNSDGLFSVGVNRNKEATIAITSDAPGAFLRGDRSNINMQSAVRVRETPDKIYSNSHDSEVSGLVYHEDLSKSPGAMINTLKSVIENRGNVVAEAITPFLLSKQDKEAKKEQENYLRERLEQSDNEGYLIMKEEFDKESRIIALKEMEERRLIHNLTSTVEKMKEQANRLDKDYKKASLFHSESWKDEEEEDNDDDENKDDDNKEDKEDENKDDDENKDIDDKGDEI